MTNEEAYKAIKTTLSDEGYCIIDSVLETAMKALEKQIPKKIIHLKYDRFQCPNCETTNCDYGVMYDDTGKLNHCSICGQALDWSDENG